MPHLNKSAVEYTYLLSCVEILLGSILIFKLFLHGLLLLLVNLLLQFYYSSLDPRMLECLFRSHTLLHLPLKTLVHKVNEHVILALHHFSQAFGVRVPYLTLRIRVLQWPIVVIEEDLSAGSHYNHGTRWETFDFHNALDLLFLILTGEYWETNIQLIEDAAQRPHINCRGISDSHHDLRSSVKPRLDVGVELISFVRS